MKVTENIRLRELNSFGVEARAARLVEWNDAGELAEVDFGGRWMALGGGCNVLFTADFDGTLVKSAAREITIEREDADKLFVKADAGVVWDDLVRWCVERGVWGAENLSAIPGTVGAAPIQNIGAYGAEAADIIAAVEYFDVEARGMRTLRADACRFGYRESVFKHELRGRAVVASALFALSKRPRPNIGYAGLAVRLDARGTQPAREGAHVSKSAPHPTLAEIRRAVMETRAEKLPDPGVTGNAGSFFKNPVVEVTVADAIAARYPDMPRWTVDSAAGTPPRVKLSAGWLIEKAGWKGRTEGRVGIHPRQALIVVNTGGATGAEIVAFAERLAADVTGKFGVELAPEVQMVP